MTSEKDQSAPLPKGQTTEAQGIKPEQQKSISVEQILGMYPIDRERAKDTVLLEISKSLSSISNSLSTMVNLKIKRMNERMEQKSDQ